MKEISFIIRTLRDYKIIPIEKITVCKAEGSYSVINLDDGSDILVSKSLLYIERQLNDKYFIRCHNSYLINAQKIQSFNRKLKILTISGLSVPVSRRKCRNLILKMKEIYSHFQKIINQLQIRLPLINYNKPVTKFSELLV